MTPRAEQLVLEYLARVGGVASAHLPPTRRTVYLSGLRARITKDCATAGATESEQVARVLRRLGDPAELVLRECGPQGEDVPKEEVEEPSTVGGLTRPAVYRRDPPPWRGGPRRGRLRRHVPARGSGTSVAGGRAPAAKSTAYWILAGSRANPLEAAAVLLYLASGLSEAVVFLWLVGVVQVGLSRVWSTRDKWAGVAIPLLGTVMGMATWRSDVVYIYIDEIIGLSLMGPGLVGMRFAAFVGGCYLLVRLSRIAREDAS
ncbi:hypothetical protein [Nocardiopsis ansamitocini]|uniref:Uncharacterized protein n=1 Tax=Nocardiopsis ansamitocini TaxID=1670832 RepID=A0A9W6UGG5_9ACTN|nr:hypothetical protein [Nocardiopsis ansamitocini]GLU47431.1 hypothetical protein Nans01_17820 [Nocardiopsis ansamitocini]